MAGARQILKGTLDKIESTVINSHVEVDALIDKVISDIETDRCVVGFYIHVITGQTETKDMGRTEVHLEQ